MALGQNGSWLKWLLFNVSKAVLGYCKMARG